MNRTLQDLMRVATRLTQSGRLNEATGAIQRALSGAASAGPETLRARAPVPAAASSPPMVLDGCVFETNTAPPATAAATDSAPGEFGSGIHTHASLTRSYKLYVPPGTAGRALPLVVMLHGCTQSPDDFAAGTGMNEQAREHGFFVLYPAQAQDANPSRCWNWFKHNHQQRGSGEPALIASLTQAVMKQHGIDPRRVYIAGLSAGGAMATIVAEAYPEIFAAVGVHSGLPRGAASSVPEALAVMNSGEPRAGVQARAARSRAAQAAQVPSHKPVPTIVFHGDQDRTVHPRNGEQVISAALGPADAGGPRAPHAQPARVEQGVSRHGKRFTRSTHHGAAGHAVAEHWLVHGAGHAWSGGRAAGSYTDASGPDATQEMLRFFFAHPQTPPH
jgi:poly(hydroxyalkanoate) depolymerase family esterase